MRAWLFLVVAVLTGLSAAPALAQQACNTPNDPLRPIMKTHLLPPYPPMSQTLGEEGTSLLEVRIGTDGVPADVSVVTSSGSPRLDEAAADYVKANWRWQPPIYNCQPIASITRVSLKWDLKSANPAAEPLMTLPPRADYPAGAIDRQEQGITILDVFLDAQGKILDVHMGRSSGFTDLDEKAQALVRGRHFGTVTVDGNPAPAVVAIGYNWAFQPK